MNTIIISSIILALSGIGLFVAGLYLGVHFNVHNYIKKEEARENKKAIKKRGKVEILSRMSDQESKENEDNSVEKINQEVV